jgi:hypothetical protein
MGGYSSGSGSIWRMSGLPKHMDVDDGEMETGYCFKCVTI